MTDEAAKRQAINDIMKYADSVISIIRDKYPNNAFDVTVESWYDYDMHSVVYVSIWHDRQFIEFRQPFDKSLDIIRVHAEIDKYITDNYSQVFKRAKIQNKLNYVSIYQKYIKMLQSIFHDMLIYPLSPANHNMIVCVNRNDLGLVDNQKITKLNLLFRMDYGIYSTVKIVYSDKYDETASLNEYMEQK